MSFEWLTFLEQRGIEYSTRGPNVSRGYITISCPFCPDGDPSRHMSLSLNRGSWKCWRNQMDHRGARPHRLIQALIQCSYEEARAIVGDDGFVLGTAESFQDQVSECLLGPRKRNETRPILDFLPEMRPPRKVGPTACFIDYLEDRYYTRSEALDLCDRYELQCAITGRFAYRLVVPVFMDFGLANWTGRAISPRALVRYRTLTTDAQKAEEDGLPPAACSIEETLWNYGELLDQGGETLVVVEGPFDALRVDYFGRVCDTRGTCLFGKNLSSVQVALLGNLAGVFRRKVVLLDNDASLDALRLGSRLAHLGFEFKQVPVGVKDPALMDPEEIEEI